MFTETPEQVLEAVVEGINTGNSEMLLALYEPQAAFATSKTMIYSHVLNRGGRGVRSPVDGVLGDARLPD